MGTAEISLRDATIFINVPTDLSGTQIVRSLKNVISLRDTKFFINITTDLSGTPMVRSQSLETSKIRIP